MIRLFQNSSFQTFHTITQYNIIIFGDVYQITAIVLSLKISENDEIKLISNKKEHLIKLLKKNSIFASNYWSRPKLLQHKNLSHNLYENLILLPNDFDLTDKKINHMFEIINSFYGKN